MSEGAPPALCALVGAGPGNPGLLTLRGAELLRAADLVIYDKLVSPFLLELAPTVARRVCVAELALHHVDRQQPVHDLMIAAARGGQRVVRLKGGDPCIFGRGGEEAQALLHAGIPFEIVPGVTAALGASAFAGIPLTHRHSASAVAFVTGHEYPEKPEASLDWSHLALFPGTLVFYMGMSRLPLIARTLIEQGKPPHTPTAVVQQATTGLQRTVSGRLDEIAERVRQSGLCPPALVIVGDVVAFRQRLDWFERLPLHGRRVLVTRPRHQASDMVLRLLELGAVPFVMPTVEIQPLQDWTEVDRALRHLGQYAWLVFTSANGVHAFIGRLKAIGLDLRVFGDVKLACIGPKTAEALRQYHLEADLVPARFQSEDLAEALRQVLRPGEAVLLARADRGRELLREQLQSVARVDQVAVYSQVDSLADEEATLAMLRRGEIEFVTLTSSNIARALLARLDATTTQRIRQGDIKLVTISPVTTQALRDLGFEPAAEAITATTEGVIDALQLCAKANHG